MSDLVIVLIPCPVCGKNYEAWAHLDNTYPQDRFHFDEAPIEVIASLDNYGPYLCQKCKSIFKMETNFSAKILLIEKGRFGNAYKN